MADPGLHLLLLNDNRFVKCRKNFRVHFTFTLIRLELKHCIMVKCCSYRNPEFSPVQTDPHQHKNKCSEHSSSDYHNPKKTNRIYYHMIRLLLPESIFFKSYQLKYAIKIRNKKNKLLVLLSCSYFGHPVQTVNLN